MFSYKHNSHKKKPVAHKAYNIIGKTNVRDGTSFTSDIETADVENIDMFRGDAEDENDKKVST